MIDRDSRQPGIRRLMRKMGIKAICRAPHTRFPDKGAEHKVHPYLLRQRQVKAPMKSGAATITYIPMPRGHVYLVAIMDWHTRAVISWRLSNTLDTRFCLEAFDEAVRVAGRVPEIFDTDQGCQFTSRAWRERLTGHGVRISMDGKGRCGQG